MLWHKAWLETRGRFLGGLALSVIVGFGLIYDFRATERLLPLVRSIDPSALDTSGLVGAALKESLRGAADVSAGSSGGSGTGRT